MSVQVDIPTKPASTSLTIWFNVAGGILFALGLFVESYKPLGIDLPSQASAWLTMVSLVGNGLLRYYKTNQPLGPQGGFKTVTVDPPKTAG